MIKRSLIWKVFLFLLMAGAGLVCASCSSDDDEIIINEKDYIETVSDAGTVGYSKDYGNEPGEHRWYIRCSPKMDFYIDGATYYFPTSLPKQFQKEGLKVRFEGDVYPFESRYGEPYPSGGFPIGGYYFYFIKLNNIEINE